MKIYDLCRLSPSANIKDLDRINLLVKSLLKHPLIDLISLPESSLLILNRIISNSMKTKHIFYSVTVGLSLLTSCKEETKYEFPADVTTILKVSDIGIKNNFSDVWAEISINKEVTANSLVEIRALLQKSNSAAGLSETEIVNLSADRFFSLRNFNFKADNKIVIEPSESIKDIEGNPISGDNDYKFYIAVIGKDNAFSLSAPKNLRLSSQSKYSGKYLGVWNDQLIKNLLISMIIFDDNTGRLYYTKGFSPCCGGSQDATFEMTDNADATTSFSFNQYLGNYPPGTGGHCEALMSTLGSLKDEKLLLLNSFPFSDCDGGGRTVVISSLTRQ